MSTLGLWAMLTMLKVTWLFHTAYKREEGFTFPLAGVLHDGALIAVFSLCVFTGRNIFWAELVILVNELLVYAIIPLTFVRVLQIIPLTLVGVFIAWEDTVELYKIHGMKVLIGSWHIIVTVWLIIDIYNR